MHTSDGTGSGALVGPLWSHPPALRTGGDLSYVQGSLGTPFMACLPLCLGSSFLFKSRLRVAPFFSFPSGCCRKTRSLCDWLMPGSFCWCRRRKKSLALFLRIPSARGEHRSVRAVGRWAQAKEDTMLSETCDKKLGTPSRNSHCP